MWISPAAPQHMSARLCSKASSFLSPYLLNSQMTGRIAIQISDLVNSPKTDDSRCIEPVRIYRDGFDHEFGLFPRTHAAN
jgi:hypothetical protein